MVVIPAIYFFGILLFDILNDLAQLKDGKDTRHGWEAFLQVVALSPSVYLFVRFHPSHNIAWLLVCVLMMEFFVYWTLFDGFYNILRNQPWQYTGSNEGKKDAWLDRMQRFLGPAFSMIIKITGCVTWVTIYIITYIRALNLYH